MLARTHYEKGMKRIARGDEAGGEQEILRAVEAFPDLPEAHIQLGNLSMKRKNFLEALERYDRARQAFVNLHGMSRERTIERRRRLQESIDLLQERIDDLRRSQAPGDQRLVDQETLRLDKLRQELLKTQPEDTDPVPPEVFFLLGTARMNLERFDEAIRDFEAALSRRSAYGEAHNNLAVIYLYRKDYPRAWKHVHAAELAGVRVNPQFRAELSALLQEPAVDSE